MPKKGKGRGIAARQAQLSRKKGRGKARSQTFDAGPTESQSASIAAGPDATEGIRQEEAGAVATAAPAPRLSRRRRQRGATEEVALTYKYLGRELRQIAIVTAFIGVILAVLTVVLGG